MDAVIIRLKEDLALTCKGFTILDSNGDYNIYLNARLSAETQAKTLRHEVYHIQQGHFYMDDHVDVLEEQTLLEA